MSLAGPPVKAAMSGQEDSVLPPRARSLGRRPRVIVCVEGNSSAAREPGGSPASREVCAALPMPLFQDSYQVPG